jgi:F-type H+-transporting ATPase subunit delta
MADNAAVQAPPTVFDESIVELSRVYSEAILAAATKAGAVREIVEDLGGVAEVFTSEPGTLQRFATSGRTPEEIDRILTKTFDGKAHPLVVNLLRVLNSKGRLALIPALADRVAREADRLLDRVRVSVSSARPLSPDQIESLSKSLKQRIGLEPVLQTSVDPALIGGLVIRVGDLQFDSSIRSRLEQLRKNLLEGKIHEIQSRRDQLHTSA